MVFTNALGLVLAAGLIALAGCETGPASFLGARDREISAATEAIEAARDDAQRAKAYSSRGAAYSEKARYSRISKLISNDEYERLFDLAIKDHNRAVALKQDDAEIYFNRAQAYYDRGTGDLVYSTEIWKVDPATKEWLEKAAADFVKAIERNPKYTLAIDRLGLTYEQAGEEDKAVQAYTQEIPLDPFGKQRLADAYCFFGFRHQQVKEYAAAAAAYEKSIEFGRADDKSCPYEPVESLVAIYTTETHQYDKAWDVVHRAQTLTHRISPEVIERLKRESGRSE